jgi:hypothetical protein
MVVRHIYSVGRHFVGGLLRRSGKKLRNFSWAAKSDSDDEVVLKKGGEKVLVLLGMHPWGSNKKTCFHQTPKATSLGDRHNWNAFPSPLCHLSVSGNISELRAADDAELQEVWWNQAECVLFWGNSWKGEIKVQGKLWTVDASDWILSLRGIANSQTGATLLMNIWVCQSSDTFEGIFVLYSSLANAFGDIKWD